MSKTIVVYLPEGFADWEGAFLLPELKQKNIKTKIISETGKPVQSIGGLTVNVDGDLSIINKSETEALVLIGSDSWAEADKNQPILKVTKDFLQSQKLVAAICAATVALARENLLEGYQHTSNDLDFLKQIVPTYKNEKNYLDQLVVTDKNLITASGVGAIDFTHAVMTYLKMYDEAKLKQWYDLYKNGTKPPLEFWS